MSHHHDDESQTCMPIQFFGFGQIFNANCNGQTVELFRTTHDVKARNANVELSNNGTCPVTFTIVECKGKIFQQVVQPSTEITLVFPCITSVSVTCSNNPTNRCQASAGVSYTLCVCCEQEES